MKVHLVRGVEENGPKREEKVGGPKAAKSRGVVKVPSLLFDIELEDTLTEDQLDEDVQESLQQIRSLVSPRTVFEQQLWSKVQQAQEQAGKEGTKLDAFVLASKLHVPGHTFKVRTALGGGCGGNCLRQLRHFFLACTIPGTPCALNYVVDPCFKEQFEIANPSPRYSLILSELPRELVNTEDRVAALVTVLCNEIKRSFQATGATLPPWRHAASMMSKWRPRRSEDTVVTSQPTSHTVGFFKERRPTEYRAGRFLHPTKEAFSGEASSVTDVMHVMAEPAASAAPGFRQMHSASGAQLTNPPTVDGPFMSSKRGREIPVASSMYSSMLATKLRGVSAVECGERGHMYSNRSQA